MRIINRYVDPVYVRAFSPGDGTHVFGIAEKDRLANNEVFEHGMGQDTVQLEFKTAGYGVRGVMLQAASTSRQFSNSQTTVFAGTGQAVELSDALLQLMNPGGYFHSTDPTKPTPTSVDFARITTAILALTDGLVSGYAQTGLLKGGALGPIKLATAIVGIFQDQRSPPSLQLSDITQSLQKVIDENEARINVPHILAAADWFDKYVKKSAALQSDASSDIKVDLKPYDRAQFIDELNKHLDENTPFAPALAVLTSNRDILKHAIPEYIMGVALFLQMARIELLLKQEKEPLDQSDVDALKRYIERFKTALSYAEEDFKKMRDDLFRQYPLLNPGSYEEGSLFVPEAPEGISLGKGITVKYLKGDRSIVQKAIERLTRIGNQLDQLRLN